MPTVSEDLTIPFTIGGRSIIAERLIEKLEPWMTPDLEILCEAIGSMTEPLMEVLEEEGYPDEPGWVPAYGRIFDPETCPPAFLSYLAMFVGAQIPIGTPEEEARQLVKAESGLERGTRASVESAITRALKVGAPFDLIERTNPAGEPDPYWFLVVVNSADLVPEGNPAKLEANVNGTKPAGLAWEVVQVDEAIWDEATLTWNEVGAGVLWSTVTKEQIT